MQFEQITESLIYNLYILQITYYREGLGDVFILVFVNICFFDNFSLPPLNVLKDA